MVTSNTAQPQVRAEEPAPRRGRSVRVRLLGWYVALLGVSLVAALLLQRAFLLAQMRTSVEEALNQEVAELTQLANGLNPETGESFGQDVSAVFDNFFARNVSLDGEGVLTYLNDAIYKTDLTGSTLADLERASSWAGARDTERGVIEDGELGEIRYLAVPLRGGETENGVFVVTVQMASRLATLDGVIRIGAVVYGSIFLLASALSWVAAGRILRPLDDLTETARSISETDLSRRIEVEGDDEIAELSRTFNSMLDRLDEAFAVQRRFIDDAGHELRTPITIIRGNLEVMGDDPEERRETMAVVSDELERMTRIVDDLLDLAKAEQPDFIRPAPMDLADFTRDLSLKAAALDDREWVVESAPQTVIDADRHRLNQAMMNLIRNASEYAPAGTPVHLGSEVIHESIRLWVRDEGEAIPPADRPRIFDRFARASGGRRSNEGAGLGLAIVAAIAEGHGGSVSFVEPWEGGNLFIMTIPQRGVDGE